MKNEELRQNAEKMEMIFSELKEKLPLPTEEAKQNILNALTNLLSA